MKKYIAGLFIIFILTVYFGYTAPPVQATTGQLDLFKSVNVPVSTGPYVKIFVRNVPAPSKYNVSDFTGYISMTSSLPYAAQVAIAVWYSPNGSCPADDEYSSYDPIKQGRPGILNTNFTNMWLSYPGTVTVPTPYHFSVKRPFSGCTFLTFDVATSPTQGASGAGITGVSHISLIYDTEPAPSPAPLAWPMGFESCFGTTQGCQVHTTCTSSNCAFINARTIVATQYLYDLFGDITVGPFSGKPYGAPPTGAWSGSSDFYIYKSCTSLTNGLHGPANYYNQIPADAVKLLSVPFQGNGSGPLNIPVSKTFPQPILLTPGNCFISLTKYSGNGAISINSEVYNLRQAVINGATSIPTPIPTSPSTKPGDLNSDAKVDIFDYNILFGNFGKTGSNIIGDINKDSKVDTADVNAFMARLGK